MLDKGGVRMETRVQKWGSSLALRIPRSYAVEVGLEQNSPVEMSLVNKKIVIVPVIEPDFGGPFGCAQDRLSRAVWTLESLLAQVNEHNLHGEVETGPALGHEAW